MAQPGDLARVGDDHVGVDDGRVVLGVSTGIRETSLYVYLPFYVFRAGQIRFPHSLSQNTRGEIGVEMCYFCKGFIVREVRNTNPTCCRG